MLHSRKCRFGTFPLSFLVPNQQPRWSHVGDWCSSMPIDGVRIAMDSHFRTEERTLHVSCMSILLIWELGLLLMPCYCCILLPSKIDVTISYMTFEIACKFSRHLSTSRMNLRVLFFRTRFILILFRERCREKAFIRGRFKGFKG